MPDDTSSPALTFLPGNSRRERAALRWQLARRVDTEIDSRRAICE